MILEARKISKSFSIESGLFNKSTGKLVALDDINFLMEPFKVLGIVGESGSGKTTLAKIILKLLEPTSGEVTFNQKLIKNFRKDVQIVFQNPYNSLNPKMRIADILAEPFIIHKIAPKKSVRNNIVKLLDMVGLDDSALKRYPFEFSGGQRQRICICRALASEPKLLVLDEPISSLDLTIQADMLELFKRLKESLQLTYIFISHNLAVIKHIADSVIVMKEGKIVEQGVSELILTNPAHRYTKLLLQAAKA